MVQSIIGFEEERRRGVRLGREDFRLEPPASGESLCLNGAAGWNGRWPRGSACSKRRRSPRWRWCGYIAQSDQPRRGVEAGPCLRLAARAAQPSGALSGGQLQYGQAGPGGRTTTTGGIGMASSPDSRVAPLQDPVFLQDLRRQMLRFATLQLSDPHLAEDAVQEAPDRCAQERRSVWRSCRAQDLGIRHSQEQDRRRATAAAAALASRPRAAGRRGRRGSA